MEPAAWIALGTLVVAVALFIGKPIPLAATALSIPVVLAATGVLDPKDCLIGFGKPAVIAIAAIFVLGAGLQEAGVARIVAGGLERVGGRSPTRAILVMMIAVAVLSAFMSNAATVAVFLPAAAVLSRRIKIPPSQLMMPLAYAAILGGTLTLIGTAPNLLLGSELFDRTGEGLGMFEFARVGAPITAVCIAFMAFVGWRMLPRVDPAAQLGGVQPEILAKSYGLARNLYCMKVLPDSRVLGKTIAEIGLGSFYHLDAVLIEREAAVGQRALHPEPELALETGDLLYVEGDAENVWRFSEDQTVPFGLSRPEEIERILGLGIALAEVTLAPRSEAVGKTLTELSFRQRFGLNVIAVWRASKVVSKDKATMPLEIGDAFLMTGPAEKFRELSLNPDFVVLGNGAIHAEDARRAPLAVGLLLLAILPPIFGWLPLAISALAGALLMVFTRCVSVDGARRNVDFTILFLLIGTIPLGIALEKTGVAAHMADIVLYAERSFGEAGLLGGLFLLSALLSTTSNNGAAAVILAPVAAKAAEVAGTSTAKAFLAVAYGASCAFILPFAHQCNLMVMSPGGYKTRDFVRVGTIVSVLMALTAALLLTHG
ncbi:MAG: SLC13 family permease [Planctomycetota bacterium]|jgi:di/tricarboxylate transporter